MNKNAAIIEGDITKKFNPVSKVKVSNSDTGESTWIPEESNETHSLSVIKNGIYYAASEGYTAYDTVTVNVSSETEVNYEGILADMPDLADLGLYDLDDLEGLEGLDLDLDEMLDLENLILDGDLEEGEIPTSSTKIKGIDPVSGETLEVGLDEDGNLMEQALPDHIHIVVWPTKRKYLLDEILDFSGIHVYMMKQGTERFTCDQYPTGEIPYDELIFPVTVAGDSRGDWDEDEQKYTQTFNILDVTLTAKTTYGYLHAFSYSYITAEGTPAYWPNILLYSDYPGNVYFTVTGNQEHSSQTRSPVTLTYYEEKDIYYANIDLNGVSHSPEYGPVTDNAVTLLPQGHAQHPTGGDIPVQWMRSDGEVLEDTFEIEIVTEEEPIPEPEPDPYADAYDFIWEGKKYCFNKSLARCEVMYSNGTVWQTWLGGQSPPYTVDQALKLKLIVQVGWSGGGSTSGGF